MSTIEKVLPKAEDMSAVDVGNAISKAWSEFVSSDNRQMTKRNNVYATGFKECTRQMVLDMTHGDTLPGYDADTLARFRRGNDRERDLMADLKKIGRNCDPSFEVAGEQERFELKGKKGRVIITGKIDGRLAFHRYKDLKFLQGQRSAPVEAKAWNANLVAQIQTYDDLFKSRWTKSGAYQILSYIYAENVPIGFFLLDRSGLPALVPVELYPNLDKMEKFLEKAETAMGHKDAGTLPDYTTEKEECKFCPHFGRNCNPPMTFGAGAQVFTDPEVVQKAERLLELEGKLSDEEWSEYAKLDKWKGVQFRGVETGIVGGLLIIGKWKKKKELIVPEDKQAEFNAAKIAFDQVVATYTVEKSEGQFSVKLVKVSDIPPAVPKVEKAAAPAKEPKPPKEPKKRKRKGEDQTSLT